MSIESKFTKYSENRQTTHDKLEELQIELDDILTNVRSGRYINLEDINKAFQIEVDAEKLKRKMDIETKKIKANAGVQHFLKNQDNSFDYDIDKQVEQVDEIYGFIMEAFNEFLDIIMQYAMSHSRPDLLKYTLKKCVTQENHQSFVINDVLGLQIAQVVKDMPVVKDVIARSKLHLSIK